MNIRSEIYDECYFTNKYNKAERLLFYPFNKAKSILLISFKEKEYIPVKNKVVDYSHVLEQVTLARDQIDSLTGLIYNVGYTPIKTTIQSITNFSCYEPRNGILFIDAKGRAFEYLEICFTCQHTVASSKLVKDGEYCSTKYDLLRNYFSKAGIKYGTGELNPPLSYQEIFKLDTESIVYAIGNKLTKKAKNGSALTALNETERTLFFTINAEKLYHGLSGISGLSQFYLAETGNFYQQTVAGLNTIGAYRTLNVLQASKKQWPGGKIPVNVLQRRKVLLKIANKADSKWKKLEEGLFDYHDKIAARILTRKEDLDGLIRNFAILHRGELID